MSQPVQLQALAYYDMLGEVHFSATFYAKLLSRVRFYPARLNEDGTSDPITSGAPVEILDQIQDPGGGRSRIQYDYGRLMFVTGEGYLFGSGNRWRFLWKDEIRKSESGTEWERVRFDKSPYNPPQIGQAYRMWTPHPRQSDLPDAPMFGVTKICEELLILTAAVQATAVSRITNGVMKIPQEMDFNSVNVGLDEDPEAGSPFLQDYVEHTEAQIENPGSAAARVPFGVVGPAEYLAMFEWMKTHDPATDYMEKELRKEAIERLAIGLDFPPEFLLGMTDANHWTAKQVVHDMWRSHGAPMAEQFGDDLAEAYLRPALEAEGFADWERVVVNYDDSQVVISPDRSADADTAMDRMAISFKGYRELKGIPESMAPSDDEVELLAAIKTRGAITVEDGELVQGERGPLRDPSMNGNAESGPPEPTAGRSVSRQEARTASIMGAAALAIRQCRQKAGSRLRSHQHGCEECRELTVPNSLVASTLGAERVNSLKLDATRLVAGGSEEFRGLLEEWGIEKAQADSLCQRVEVWAGQTLFQPGQPDLPPGFAAQVALVEEVSGALVDSEA